LVQRVVEKTSDKIEEVPRDVLEKILAE
jgi:hypothetical protein